MISPRVIPVLLLSDTGLVKTFKFASRRYIGDPINTVRIFNDKEVDEIVIIDIDATRLKREPDFKRIEEIASEAFMPLCYGGGITSIKQMECLFRLGVEKVLLNSSIFKNKSLIHEATQIFGSQSIVISVDVKKNFLGHYHIYSESGKIKEDINLLTYISWIQDQGVGEIILNSIDKDGTMSGYDLHLISIVSKKLKVPLVVLGGAGSVNDFNNALLAGASAVAAGSIFVFHGPHKAVLISYVYPNLLSNQK